MRQQTTLGMVVLGLCIGSPAAGYGQSACLPNIITHFSTGPARAVDAYVVALGHAYAAQLIVNKMDTENVFLSIRRATNELKCAKDLSRLDPPDADSLGTLALTHAAQSFDMMGMALDDMRSMLVREIDRGLGTRSAAEQDRAAESTVLAENGNKQLLLVTAVLTKLMRGFNDQGDTLTISRQERDDLLVSLKTHFGGILPAPTETDGYIHLSAHTLQTFLLNPRWKFRA